MDLLGQPATARRWRRRLEGPQFPIRFLICELSHKCVTGLWPSKTSIFVRYDMTSRDGKQACRYIVIDLERALNASAEGRLSCGRQMVMS